MELGTVLLYNSFADEEKERGEMKDFCMCMCDDVVYPPRLSLYINRPIFIC